ncbi:MAG: DUF2785 domain-containing protein [Burkholderiales bacterium]|nr:DUF2785 domain-containing protein [Burkholderiales bacterium]
MSTATTGRRAQHPGRARARLLAVWLLLAGSAAMACAPEPWSAERLGALRQAGFQVADDTQRAQLALGLVPCLASPDPTLRDTIAYEALARWLRGGALSAATARQLGEALLPMLQQRDAAGVAAPFAALALAEVARVDRLTPIWAASERLAMVQAATDWMGAITDHRGYEPPVGWRHAVAHGADWLMQLALNPALERESLDRILDAIDRQVLPADGHAYVHGESERLARPVLFVLRRGLHTPAEWASRLSRLAGRARGAAAPPTTLAGLAAMHNAKGFLYPLYIALHNGQDEAARERLLPGLVAALRELER